MSSKTVDDINALNDRLDQYEHSFKDDVEERMLLRELAGLTKNLMGLVDSKRGMVSVSEEGDDKGSDEERIAALQVRITDSEGDLSNLTSEVTTIQSNIDGSTSDVLTLVDEDVKIDSEIATLKSKESEHRTNYSDVVNPIASDISSLQTEDNDLRSTMAVKTAEINHELTDLNNRIDSIDGDAIEAEIADLQAEDVRVKAEIQTNYDYAVGEITALNDDVENIDVSEIQNDITALQAEDVTINNQITSDKSALDSDIATLQAEDVNIESDIDSIKLTLEDLPDTYPEGSLTPSVGKVPTAKDTGYIDDGWINPAIVS